MKWIINDQVIYYSDTRALSITDGSKIILPIATARLLELFFAHRRRQLSRETIIEEVWGKQGLVPSGHSLSKNVSLLRKALSELGLNNVIETIPREGFIFHAEVRGVTENESPQNEVTFMPSGCRTRSTKYRKMSLWFALGIVLIISGLKFLPELLRNNDNIVYTKTSGACEIYTKNTYSIDKINEFLRSDMWQRFNKICNEKNKTIVFYDDNSLSENNKLSEHFLSVCVMSRKGIAHECENYIY